jgi:hypothetical protein
LTITVVTTKPNHRKNPEMMPLSTLGAVPPRLRCSSSPANIQAMINSATQAMA